MGRQGEGKLAQRAGGSLEKASGEDKIEDEDEN